jgi:cell division protein FtsZ
VWAAPTEPVNEPEPEPVSFGIGENGSLSTADSLGSEGTGSGSTGSGSPAEENGFDAVPAPRPAGTSPADPGSHSTGPVTPVSRPDTAAAARVFDAATTRRRSVVFEEDDELDVPDFLK